MNGPQTSCTMCTSALEHEDLRCPVCACPVPAASSEVPTKAGTKILRCENCAAAMRYHIDHRAAACGFCGDVLRVEEPADPVEEASAHLPFSVDPSQAQQNLRTWLGKGFWRPSDLAKQASLDMFKGVYWAAWLCDVDVHVSFTGDSDAGALRASWAPHSGQEAWQERNLLVAASRGLSERECAALSAGYNLQTKASGAPLDVERVERFDLQRSKARRMLMARIWDHVVAQVPRWLPGSRHRNIRASVVMRGLSSERLALPAYILAYRYRGNLYRAVVQGQTGAVIGKAPLSVGKILMAIGIGVLVFVALAALGFR